MAPKQSMKTARKAEKAQRVLTARRITRVWLLLFPVNSFSTLVLISLFQAKISKSCLIVIHTTFVMFSMICMGTGLIWLKLESHFYLNECSFDIVLILFGS